MIDAYAHVGMPRFQTVEDCRATMQRLGIAKTLVCAFDCCTDLAEVHRAISRYPGEFRGLGLALGANRAEVERGITMQIEAGFIGLRLNVADVRDRPWLLDILGRLEAFPLVVGENALAEAAPALLKYLDANPSGLAVGGHFAGPTDPAALSRPGAVRDLFSHPRFVVVMSRQGIFAPTKIEEWAQALLGILGLGTLPVGNGSSGPLIGGMSRLAERQAGSTDLRPTPCSVPRSSRTTRNGSSSRGPARTRIHCGCRSTPGRLR